MVFYVKCILYYFRGYLISSDYQLYRVPPLKTPFGLLIPLLQSQSHVTTITHNYSLRSVTFTQLTIIHVRDYNHLSHSYTFTLADFSAIGHFDRLSHTVSHVKSSIHTTSRLRYLLRKTLAENVLREFTS
jgi:hypothetical protein